MKKDILKYAACAFTLSGIVACGGGGGGGGESNSIPTVPSEPETLECVILMNTLNVVNGSACTLTQADADLYGITAGEVACDNGIVTYEGNTFSSGANGVILNGLSFVCVDPQ